MLIYYHYNKTWQNIRLLFSIDQMAGLTKFMKDS